MGKPRSDQLTANSYRLWTPHLNHSIIDTATFLCPPFPMIFHLELVPEMMCSARSVAVIAPSSSATTAWYGPLCSIPFAEHHFFGTLWHLFCSPVSTSLALAIRPTTVAPNTGLSGLSWQTTEFDRIRFSSVVIH